MPGYEPAAAGAATKVRIARSPTGTSTYSRVRTTARILALPLAWQAWPTWPPLTSRPAPYLNAVVAYGFRGSTRFHVPGHKAGNGADLGVRTAIGWQTLKLDIPQDIHGVDLGESPTPFERAEQLAAEAYGAARSWFLTNGATQGNHALCLALGAARRAGRRAAQRARLGDRRARALRRPADVGARRSTSRSSAWRTGSRRSRSQAALEATPGARAAFIVSPTYYGMAADVEGCAEVAHAAGVPLVVDQSWGPHFGFHRDAAAERAARRRRRDAHVGAQDRRLAHPVRAAARLAAPAGSTPTRVARTLRLMRSTSPSSLLMLSLDGARRQLVLHGEALLSEHDRRLAPHRRGDRPDPRLPRRRRRGDRPARRRRTRPAADRDRRARHRRDRLRDGRRAALELRHPGRARHAGDDRARARHRRAAARARALHPRPDLDRRRTWSARARSRRSRSPPGTFENEVVDARRARRSSAPSEVVAVDDSVGRVSAEAIAGYPPGIPVLLPGERITDDVIEYLRSLKAVGARLHGASDPDFQTICVMPASGP